MAENLYLANAKLLSGEEFAEADLLVVGDSIAGIFPREAPGTAFGKAAGRRSPLTAKARCCALPPGTRRLDLQGKYLLPGFIDIHTHGGKGVDFNHADADGVRAVARFFASRGVTSFLPTILTDSPETMLRQLARVTEPSVLADCPEILGIHLEGPFLCEHYKGAQPAEYLRACDSALFARFQNAARGMIRLLTLAPEVEGAVELTRELVSQNVRVSLGHSAASYEQAMAAIEAGATCTTHIMNAMKLQHMHDPAILTAVLETDVYAEMICDGFHLHPPIVRFLIKAKGRDRMIAVTDSIMAAGLPDGHYTLGVNEVIVEGGDAKVIGTGMRAGSTLTMDRALRNIGEYTRLPLGQAARFLSENPAKMLGIFDRTGSLETGKLADIVALDNAVEGSLHVAMTIARGKISYTA
jgi:N-acetylglucosamine-6-phosphate deacetylase